MTTLTIAAALFIVKALYAFVLSRKRFRKLQPDGTWVLVAVGVGLCLAAAAIDRRLTHPPIDVYEARVLLFLIVGGIPIAVWQIGKSALALIRIEEQTYGNPTDRAGALADQPGTAARWDD